jgi:hypothetical protein
MRIVILVLALASMAPAVPRQARVDGPRVFVVGSNAAGSVRAVYTCSGFGAGPVVDVHTEGSQGGRIKDLMITPTGSGEATFSFTLEYDLGTTNPRNVTIFVTAGTGKVNDGFERINVDVRRSG